MHQPEPMVTVERRAIVGALLYTQGDKDGAAFFLQISRTTLYRRIQEWRILPEEYMKARAAGA